jgi:hypothetical protein
VLARQVARRPEPRGDRLHLLGVARLGDQHHEGGEVVVERTEAVRDPRPEARAARDLVARLHVADGRLVVDGLGVHASNEAHIINHLRRVGEQLGDRHPALAMLGELVHRRGDREPLLPRGHRRQPLAVADRLGQVLVVPLLHLRLVVVEVELRRPADHVQVDDVLGLGREVGQDRLVRLFLHRRRPRAAADPRERGECRHPHRIRPPAEELAACLVPNPFLKETHRTFLRKRELWYGGHGPPCVPARVQSEDMGGRAHPADQLSLRMWAWVPRGSVLRTRALDKPCGTGWVQPEAPQGHCFSTCPCTPGDYLLRTSSRFISSFAVMVQAASAAGSTAGSGFDSPTAINSLASFGFAW